MKKTKFKIKTGDMVKVLSGKDKGRTGKVEKIYKKKGSLLITGVNLYKRHVKGSQGGVKAGIYDIPRPLDLSKVVLVCPNCNKATKVKVVREKKEIYRVCKKCNKKIGSK